MSARGLTLNGLRFRLVEDDAVRAQDLRDHALTLEREADGERVRITAASLLDGDPRPERLPPPGRRWKLRELAEQLAELPDDPTWTAQMVRFATIHGLLEVPDGAVDRS